ncbi:MAG: SUMF1/EgtB/PvdO family nonheme iron enzyme [Candidatus Cloacimonetes bacterium]|nr:SUMF1/EgtB/PvdO family nonheme iron enzyme [Candidatus Cloacimonadota bacterium]
MALNSYNIIETLHHSRRYLLYKATKISDSSPVVIKTQDPAHISDKSLATSLKSEAEIAQYLQHPNLRKGLGCFEEGLSVYFVAEYVAGESLGERLCNNPPDFHTALNWAKKILHVLIYASSLGLSHENLNPYNIIIEPNDNLSLIGFGKNRSAWKHSEGNFKYPLPILYLAPEIYKGSKASLNSDLYSWAVIVYQAVCGMLPWRLDSFSSPEEQKQQSIDRAIILPDTNMMPDGLYSILLSCLNPDPNQRPENPHQLLDLLQQETTDLDWSLEIESIPQEASLDKISQNPESADIGISAPPDRKDSVSISSSDQKPSQALEPEEVHISAIDPMPPDPDLLKRILDLAETEWNATPPLLAPEEVHISAIDPMPPDPDLLKRILDLAETEWNATPPLKEPEEVHISAIELSFPDSELINRILIKAESELNVSPNKSEIIDTEFCDKALADASSTSDEQFVSLDEEQIYETQASQIEEQTAPLNEDKEWQDSDSIPKPTIPADEPASHPEPVFEVPQEEEKDLRSMRNSFRVLMILSVLVVAYFLAQRFILSKQQNFETPEPVLDLEEIAQPDLMENTPLKMVLVHADTLIMGSISPQANDDEFPLLTIPLKSFMISATEITQGEWRMVYSNNPSLYKDDDLPVDNISFYDAIDYCNAKSVKDGLSPAYSYYGTDLICDFDANGYRLPTEAEWELAAKSGQGKSFVHYSGSDDPSEVAWYAANSNAKSHPVKTKKPNELGIYDMSGNIYEWVWNWYAPYSYRVNDLYSGPRSGTDKVIRGGSWYHNEYLLRNTARNYVKPFTVTSYIGFRVVRSR